MRKREIAKFVRETGENPLRKPGKRDIPRPGDFDFDRKLREYNRWVEEYEYGESLVAKVPPTWTPCPHLESEHDETPITDGYSAKNPEVLDNDGYEHSVTIYRQEGLWRCVINDGLPFDLAATTLEDAQNEAAYHLEPFPL